MKTWQRVTFSSRGAMNPVWFTTSLQELLNSLEVAPGEVLIIPTANDLPHLHHVLIFTETKIDGAERIY